MAPPESGAGWPEEVGLTSLLGRGATRQLRGKDPPGLGGAPHGDLPLRTILLADDNDDSRDIYRTLFEMSGYRVIQAPNGLAVLTMVDQDRPDLILLNLLMPELDGHGVLAELRGSPETADIPCLVFTGDARFEQLGRAVKSGADAFLTKPAEPRAVLHFVEELLREGKDGEDPGVGD